MSFPEGFLWGTATSAHQVEGGNVHNDSWLAEHLPGSRYAEPSGDACDHYHRYPADVALIARLGLGAYRFSLEWSRIEPEGRRVLARRARPLPPHAGCVPRARAYAHA